MLLPLHNTSSLLQAYHARIRLKDKVMKSVSEQVQKAQVEKNMQLEASVKAQGSTNGSSGQGAPQKVVEKG